VGCAIFFQHTASSQEYSGTWEQQRACTPDVWRLCGAQIPGSWLACDEILRNSVIGAARFLHKAMRPYVVRIAATGKGATIEIMRQGLTTEATGQALTTETTGQGPTTVHGLTTMTTNKGVDPSRTPCTGPSKHSIKVKTRTHPPMARVLEAW